MPSHYRQTCCQRQFPNVSQTRALMTASWSARASPDEFVGFRAAYHEAGHCAAAIIFGIPIIHVTIEADAGHLYRGHYRGRAYLGLERIVMCLAGPAAEEFFCGPIEDGTDTADYAMARE